MQRPRRRRCLRLWLRSGLTEVEPKNNTHREQKVSEERKHKKENEPTFCFCRYRCCCHLHRSCCCCCCRCRLQFPLSLATPLQSALAVLCNKAVNPSSLWIWSLLLLPLLLPFCCFAFFSAFMFLCRALVSVVVVVVVAVVRVCCCCCCCCGRSPHVGSNIISFCWRLNNNSETWQLRSWWRMGRSWVRGRSTRCLCYMCLARTSECCPIIYYLLFVLSVLSANYAITRQPDTVINWFVCLLPQEAPRLT